MRYLVAVVLLVVVLDASAAVQSFARRETRQHFNQVKRILAVVDLNRDGRDDLIVGGQPNDGSESATDRLAKLPVRVVLGTRGGHVRIAPAAMVPRSIRARTPVVVTDDFNGDGWVDFAVFDAGVYVWEHSSGYGNRPQLYVSSPNGRRYRRSAALANAVRRAHRRRPFGGFTAVPWLTHFDVNDDGYEDVLLMHTRAGSCTAPPEGFRMARRTSIIRGQGHEPSGSVRAHPEVVAHVRAR